MSTAKVQSIFVGFGVFVLFFSWGCAANSSVVSSPDGTLQVRFSLDEQGRPHYAVDKNARPVILPSPLGLVRSDYSFAEQLTLADTSPVQKVQDRYIMPHGKRRECIYQANRRVFTLTNPAGQTMQLIFQVSNDGAAFRYAFDGKSDAGLSIVSEQTGFAFAPAAEAWLHPMQPGKSGWAATQPSYEEYYVVDTVGKPSPHGAGWCFPALFRTPAGDWVLISDTDVDRNYCAARLAHRSDGGVYRIAFPHPQEHRGPQDPVEPQITLPFQSPWRVLVIGDSLRPLVETTLMTDLAAPSQIDSPDFIQAGRASWHWLRYGDDSSTLEVAERFLAFSDEMNWEYMLIDCNWDRNIGYEKMAEFIQKARQKNVGVILWYNSNGSWNTAPMTPKDRMYPRSVRREELARLQQMGVKGIKVDFFGGDKQATMQLYLDLFEDAADYGIMVNVHGATVPRGWQRTYPNLMTAEAVKGMEYVTFDQRNADQQAHHCTILPFTRNVVSSMDFTPVVFNPRIRGVQVRTTPAFELALSVVFESGIQHFGLVPEERPLMPDFVVDFLRKVPAAWDDTRFVDGYPGRSVILARRSGETWYVAGLNGQNEAQTLAADLSFLGQGRWQGDQIADGANRTFDLTPIRTTSDATHRVHVPARGGFVMRLSPAN